MIRVLGIVAFVTMLAFVPAAHADVPPLCDITEPDSCFPCQPRTPITEFGWLNECIPPLQDDP